MKNHEDLLEILQTMPDLLNFRHLIELGLYNTRAEVDGACKRGVLPPGIRLARRWIFYKKDIIANIEKILQQSTVDVDEEDTPISVSRSFRMSTKYHAYFRQIKGYLQGKNSENISDGKAMEFVIDKVYKDMFKK